MKTAMWIVIIGIGLQACGGAKAEETDAQTVAIEDSAVLGDADQDHAHDAATMLHDVQTTQDAHGVQDSAASLRDASDADTRVTEPLNIQGDLDGTPITPMISVVAVYGSWGGVQIASREVHTCFLPTDSTCYQWIELNGQLDQPAHLELSDHGSQSIIFTDSCDPSMPSLISTSGTIDVEQAGPGPVGHVRLRFDAMLSNGNKTGHIMGTIDTDYCSMN